MIFPILNYLKIGEKKPDAMSYQAPGASLEIDGLQFGGHERDTTQRFTPGPNQNDFRPLGAAATPTHDAGGRGGKEGVRGSPFTFWGKGGARDEGGRRRRGKFGRRFFKGGVWGSTSTGKGLGIGQTKGELGGPIYSLGLKRDLPKKRPGKNLKSFWG